MAWWRRDPSFLSRSPVHRYTQRILREHEAALRTRCFSRTPSNSDQHEEGDGGKRPDGMSNLEWMQLQHYKRWTKRLRDDPYQAIFGASNDMLSGRGLKDWEWIHKSFPKWMLREMDLEEVPKKEASKKIDIVNESGHQASQRESHFPQPSFRKGRFEQEVSSGIVSPSDLRRPQENSHVKVVAKDSAESPHKTLSAHEPTISPNVSPLTIQLGPGTLQNKITTADQASKLPLQVRRTTDTAKAEAETRESSFINAFLTEGSKGESLDSRRGAENNMWRQTTLQRRLSSRPAVNEPRRSPSVTVPNEAEVPEVPDVPQAVPIPTLQASNAVLGDQSTEVRSNDRDWLIEQQDSNTSTAPKLQDRPAPARSTSQILEQLPEEDIDFLSAADIRANMGVKRSNLPSSEQRKADRQRLEQTFANVNEDVKDLDEMIESKVINDQLIRRKEREMREAQYIAEISAVEPINDFQKESQIVEPPQVESSIDRMKRWLETTGASFAKQFWQDPTESEDITKSRLFFDKAYHYIRKGRAAMRPIVEDMEKDIPAARALLKRLNKDEEILELAVHRLRQRPPSGIVQGLTPRKIKAMESIKVRFQQTNTELDKACAALRDIAATTSAAEVPESFKRRLSVASKVLHKNSQLSRMLIYSLQARLEDPKIDRNILPNYKIVADDLLSLRDTQMTLTRLVDRAMLVYGVAPQTAVNSKSSSSGDGELLTQKALEFENCEDPFIRARLAADAHLINEIKAHKPIESTSSEDSQSSVSKAKSVVALEDPKPLAHSLMRPFGLAFEQLGTKSEPDTVAERAKKESEKKIRDQALVSEIQKVYEETYGAITVGHRQIDSEAPLAVSSEPTLVKGFEMLKDDPTQVVEATVLTDAPIPSLSPNHSSVSTEPVTQVEATPASDSGFEIPTIKSEDGLGANTPSTSQSQSPSLTSSVPKTSEPVSPINEPQTSVNPVATPESSEASEINNGTLSTQTSTKPLNHLPTHYTILIHDPKTDSLSITTSTSGPPRDTSPAVPFHQALGSLHAPAKFIPYITEGLEVVSARKYMLVLRDSLDLNSSTRAFETIAAPSSYAKLEDSGVSKGGVNPIDGTARLSPTGYVGPEESPEQLEKEFKERREAAGKINNKQQNAFAQSGKEPQGRKKRAGAGIVKTAIWAAALCYVVGVFGEIATSPFKV